MTTLLRFLPGIREIRVSRIAWELVIFWVGNRPNPKNPASDFWYEAEVKYPYNGVSGTVSSNMGIGVHIHLEFNSVAKASVKRTSSRQKY